MKEWRFHSQTSKESEAPSPLPIFVFTTENYFKVVHPAARSRIRHIVILLSRRTDNWSSLEKEGSLESLEPLDRW